jgi:hypothetical protein
MFDPPSRSTTTPGAGSFNFIDLLLAITAGRPSIFMVGNPGRHHHKRPHHVVILVLQDAAVIHEPAGERGEDHSEKQVVDPVVGRECESAQVWNPEEVQLFNPVWR